MTTSPKTSFLSEVENGEPIPLGKLAYLRERQRNRLYSFIVKKFLEQEKKSGLTRAELARRINRRPEQVTRWLGAPGNWTLDTVADLLVGIAAEELQPASVSLLGRAARNHTQPNWLRVPTHITLSTSSLQDLGQRTFASPQGNVSQTREVIHVG